MGLMYCSRNGCDENLCRRYSMEYGYICSDCFRELVQKGVQTDVHAFLDSRKSEQDETEAAFAYFDRLFSDD